MFEDPASSLVWLPGSQLKLDKAILRYQQHKVYQALLQNKTLSGSIKKKIKESHYKQILLKKIKESMENPTRPEEAFEIWNQSDHMNVYRRSTNTEPLKFDEEFLDNMLTNAQRHREEENGDSGNDDDDSGSELIKEHLFEEYFNKLTRPADFSGISRKPKLEFLLTTEGYEVLPLPSEETKTGFYRYHIANLNFFLHSSILNKSWDQAYKILCILLRFPGIDIRYLWPLAIEILRGKHNENKETTSVFKYKERRFFSWLASFYILSASRPGLVENAPVFRSGSVTHVPIFIIESIWSLLDDGQVERVKTEVKSLILKAPFENEGVFSFILCLCYLMENVQLADRYAKVDTSDENDLEVNIFLNDKASIYAKISSNFEEVDKYLHKCTELKFEYPPDIVEVQTNIILSKIKEADEANTGNQSDEDNISEEEIPDPYDTMNDTNNHNEDEVSHDTIIEQANEGTEISKRVSLEDEIPDSYIDDEEEEIPDQYDDEDEIADQYVDVVPVTETRNTINNERNDDSDSSIDFDFDFD
ncbi:rDNA transcription factor component [Yamadazyma tenuis]|uniref:RNA polymerase I-specific transcription initiation factor RRN11 n=1 Tax=Candida tenuis (strain ATCC 10573 / BCRC 21748 / CBS 615 / JCM 9827 / NBRC 10315 / NRRL Y-1498 / VKM Y-70) TaxID=590646 RepID=G3B9U1_CANTC|nr:uncharacterized protein CANTEDRAFT_135901 [Yamadazyma tenuis ATCC 10573]EGV61970.1 hypothetical protein CANTEDRAFT_135901 [Yamadazyma tenuis ATCC 10573]WEJ93218.1 rDNA transcription factor component [Yamadazyma tenuis]